MCCHNDMTVSTDRPVVRGDAWMWRLLLLMLGCCEGRGTERDSCRLTAPPRARRLTSSWRHGRRRERRTAWAGGLESRSRRALSRRVILTTNTHARTL